MESQDLETHLNRTEMLSLLGLGLRQKEGTKFRFRLRLELHCKMMEISCNYKYKRNKATFAKYYYNNQLVIHVVDADQMVRFSG